MPYRCRESWGKYAARMGCGQAQAHLRSGRAWRSSRIGPGAANDGAPSFAGPQRGGVSPANGVWEKTAATVRRRRRRFPFDCSAEASVSGSLCTGGK